MAHLTTATVLALFAFTVYAQACIPSFQDCGSKGGKLNSLSFNGTCQETSKGSGRFEVLLKKNSEAGITIVFDAGEDAKSLKAVVHGIIAGIPVPFPLKNPDACQNSNVTCPLKSGTKYTYATGIPVQSSYPKISLIVKWELVDENKNDVICVMIPAEITA